MDYTLDGTPVSRVTIKPDPGPREELDMEQRVSDVLELFSLQAHRQSAYGLHRSDPFGKEPGNHWNPIQTWIALPDGSCDPHILQIGRKNVITYAQIAEIYHNDYKLQGALRAWLSLGQKESIWKVTEQTGYPFLERDAFLWRVATEALHEAMFQCFVWKWLHNWERPVPAIKRVLAQPDQYPKLVDAMQVDINAAQSHGVLTDLYPEGAPKHPSFPAGHAVCIASQVTVLRAFYDTEAALPMNPDRTVGEELAANARAVCLARMIAGIHYRRDMTAGLGLGEAVARKVLAKYGLDKNLDKVWWETDNAVPAFELERWKSK